MVEQELLLTIAQAAVMMGRSRRQTRRILTRINAERPGLGLLQRVAGCRPYGVNPYALRWVMDHKLDVRV